MMLIRASIHPLVILALCTAVAESFQTAVAPRGEIFRDRVLTKLYSAVGIQAAPSSQISLEFVKTPGSRSTLHNFGPASPLDHVLYTAERPGDPSKDDTTTVSEKKVADWISFVQSKGITNVVVLLDNNELGVYGEPGLLQLYQEGGMNCLVAPMGDQGACERILTFITDADHRGEKVVTHCTGGVGRAGRVAAAWIAHRHGLSPQVASLIALDTAFAHCVKRLGHTQKLIDWIG